MLESIGKRGNWLLIILKLVDWRKHTETSIQTLYVYSTLKRRGHDRFYVVSTWNTRGVFVEMQGHTNYSGRQKYNGANEMSTQQKICTLNKTS